MPIAFRTPTASLCALLSESKQRRLCRLLFCWACVAPLVASLGWAAVRQLPAYQAAAIAELGAPLGLLCECDRYTTPRPTEIIAWGVRVSTRGASEPLATCDRLQLRREPDGWRFAAGTLEIKRPAEVQSTLSGWARSARQFRLHGTTQVLVLSRAGSVAARFTQVVTEVRSPTEESGGTSAMLAIDLKSVPEQAELQLEMLGSASGELHTTATIDTGSVGVSAAWLPTPIAMPADVLFSGRIENRVDGGLARGRLTLPASHSGNGPVRATWSPTTLVVHEARWSDSRFQRVHATIDARRGWAHRSLLNAASDHLGAKQTPRVAEQASGEAIWYDRFACDIDLDSSGVTLTAACGEEDGKKLPGAIAHALLQSEGQPLVFEPREKRLQLAEVLHTIWPSASAALPANSPATRLASQLPLPQ
ncbi:hypothetical protein [Botrimarina hoheduenensis]|uniref:hypothetical protein n=1 Tax=Botrimarina hoheduenensis TaxID=2528000 RepID=UPI0011B530D4|nr:hypothetical protein [Botrimarina hoheduenensis]